MAHSGRRRFLLILVTVAAAALAWYYFSQIYGHDNSIPGTLVRLEEICL